MWLLLIVKEEVMCILFGNIIWGGCNLNCVKACS